MLSNEILGTRLQRIVFLTSTKAKSSVQWWETPCTLFETRQLTPWSQDSRDFLHQIQNKQMKLRPLLYNAETLRRLMSNTKTPEIELRVQKFEPPTLESNNKYFQEKHLQTSGLTKDTESSESSISSFHRWKPIFFYIMAQQFFFSSPVGAAAPPLCCANLLDSDGL